MFPLVTEKHPRAVIGFLAAACLVNVLLTTYNVGLRVIAYSRTKTSPARAYTYHGHDYPVYFPTESHPEGIELPSVDMVFQESGNYPLIHPWSETDLGAINGPWNGIIRLGPHKRAFIVAMWHELHCMRIFRSAFEPVPPPGIKHHMHHCLSYIRQTFLCDTDLALEPRDFLNQNFTTQRTLPPRQCRDWGSLYSELEANFVDWRRYAKENDIKLTHD